MEVPKPVVLRPSVYYPNNLVSLATVRDSIIGQQIPAEKLLVLDRELCDLLPQNVGGVALRSPNLPNNL